MPSSWFDAPVSRRCWCALEGGHATTEQLPTRQVIAATRRVDKVPAYLGRGHIGVAARASSAMPGLA